MDALLRLQPGEQILRKERIHPGIFVLPAVVLITLGLVELGPLLIFQKMIGAFQSLNRTPSSAPQLLLLVSLFMTSIPVLVVFLVVLAAYLKGEIILTSKRLSYRVGLVQRVSGELPLENVEALFIVEPILGRVFGYGTVAVSGIGGAQFPLRYIRNPQSFYMALQRAVAEAKGTNRPRPGPPPPTQDDSRYMPKR